jgi:hypothetical protein
MSFHQRKRSSASDAITTPTTGTVGASTATQRHAANVGDVQRASDHAAMDAAWVGPIQLSRDAHSGLDDRGIQAAAAHGISGAGGPLPHLDAIQRSFGEHDVSGVSAHVGGAAAEASDAMGAHAYATGNSVAFAESPSLFLVAHEAAHVVQQRAGVQLSSAVGQAGDAYEQNADAVAARVVAGESAADLLGPARAGGAGAVQRDAKTDKKGGGDPTEASLKEIATNMTFVMSGAKAAMGTKDEGKDITDNASGLGAFLGQARSALRKAGPGGTAAQYEHVVRSMQSPVDTMYQWARSAKVAQGKAGVEEMLDRWDDVLSLVGMDPQRKASTFYADREIDNTATPELGKKGKVQQHTLVDACVNLFAAQSTFAPALGIEQFETLLNEPAAVPEISMLEKLFRIAVTAALGALPGIIGDKLGAAFSEVLELSAEHKEVFIGKLTCVIKLGTGEAEDAVKAPSTKPVAIAGDHVKSAFIDRMREGALGAIGRIAVALGTYKEDLARLPPEVVSAIYHSLQTLAHRVWVDAKSRMIYEWLNFEASLHKGVVKDHPEQLDFKNGIALEGDKSKLDPIGRLQDRKGIYTQVIDVSEDRKKKELHAKAGPAHVDGIEDALKAELIAAKTPLMQLGIHRKIEIPKMAKVYLPAHGGVVVESWDDLYLLSKIGRNESISWPTVTRRGTGDSVLDRMEVTEEISDQEKALIRAGYPSDPAAGLAGILRILGLANTGSGDIT